ncbi:MAG TPA: nuclear transport factor 2 family protein, partial [Pyrinomonadaceae bacterium]|nr:nuclear transport factor 2 family protein [Pyrinomonadaceae bacterium]
MRKTILAAALALAAATYVSAQTPAATTPAGQGSAEQALVKLTQDWLDAEAKHDRAALERIVADDFSGTAPGGNTVTKRDVIPAEGSRGDGFAFTAQDVRARVFGETGVVTGRGVSRGQGPE